LPSRPRADEPVLLYPPLGVVILHELTYRTTDLLDVSEDLAVVVDGIRYELPAHFGHLRSVSLRSPSWDKSQMTLVDPKTGAPVARVLPQDKAQNASGRRRSIQSPPNPIPPHFA
jgi:hypothetical protein